MIVRIIGAIALIVLVAGFVFFAANVIWLGIKEFFKIYGPKAKPKEPQLLKENNNKEN